MAVMFTNPDPAQDSRRSFARRGGPRVSWACAVALLAGGLAVTASGVAGPDRRSALDAPIPRADGSRRLIGLETLRRVDAGVEDLGGLEAPARLIDKGLRQPNDWIGVYQIPQGTGTRFDGWFVRVHGGVYAVFPRSEYVPTQDGVYVPVPAGTLFFVGGIPLADDVARPGRGLEAVDTRRDLRLAEGGRITGQEPLSPVDAREGIGRESSRLNGSVDAGAEAGRERVPPGLEGGRGSVSWDRGASPPGAVLRMMELNAEDARLRDAGERWLTDEGYRAGRIERLMQRASGG